MPILDQFGRYIKAKLLRRPETRVAAAAEIRDRLSGYPSAGLTPTRLAQILRSADEGDMLSQAELFEEMEEKDPHLFSQFQTRKLAVQGLEWDVNPGDESAKAKEIARACEEFLDDLPAFDDNILDMLDALPKGYSVLELLWDASSGQAALTGMEWIHPKKITFRDSFIPRVLTDAEPLSGEDMQPFKFVYHRYKARSGYDTRAGIMRVCAWMYLFKNYDVKDWVGFAEVFGKPLRVGKYDSAASQDDKDALSLAVRMLGSDAAGVISKATEIEFIQAQTTGSIDVYSGLAAFCDAQVSKAILGQTLTSDSGDNGSRALGQVHNDVRGDLTRADAKALGRTVTQQILRPFVGYNFGWGVPMPTAEPVYEEPEDLEAVGKVYQILAGMIDISQEHIADRFKVPLMKQGETPVKQNTARGEGSGPASGAGQDGSAGTLKHVLKDTAPNRFTPDQQVLEDLADRVVAQAAGQFDDHRGAILDAIRGAGSYADAVASLLDLYPGLSTNSFEDLMARTLTNAEIFGRWTVENDG